MSAAPDDVLTTYPGTPYDVRAPNSDDQLLLPAGHGAVAIEAWCPRSEQNAALPIIGVDGKPATHGFGRALIVVPAGERLIEVQEGRPRQTTQLTIAEGQVTEFEYSPVLKPTRGRQQDGKRSPARTPGHAFQAWMSLAIGVVSVVWIVFFVGITWYGGVPAVGALGALLGLYGMWVGYSGWKGSQRPKRSQKRKGTR
ncbi:hypothetical protein ABN028_28095 [Actinopolymorpha sp. B17G11]|uniref:hypothetical protein n=1 Tax=unclassified Actinopolymorpha TaxID=2627063 RepID=UPI0032D8DD0C